MRTQAHIYAVEIEGVAHFKLRKPPKGKYIKLTAAEHAKLIDGANSPGNNHVVIEDGVIMVKAIDSALTWDDVRFKASNILRRTDRLVSVPDYPITDSKREEVLAYRAKLWTIESDFSSPDKVIWPEPPKGIK